MAITNIKNLQTETLDKLFLELSQFSKATTASEIRLKEPLEFAVRSGANWTLEDWQNWRTYHAEKAI